MFASAKARSGWPLTRLTMLPNKLYAPLLYWNSAPGAKLSPCVRARIFEIASFGSTPSSRGGANPCSKKASRSPLVWVSRCRIVIRLPWSPNSRIYF